MASYRVVCNSTNDVGTVLRGRIVRGVGQILVQWDSSGLNEWVNVSEVTPID